jgi:hypothetical protein
VSTLKQSVSVRSQSAFIIFLLAVGWVLGGSFDISIRGADGIVNIISWAIPIFTLILVVSYFISGRQHKSWFFTAVAAVVISFVIMAL